jgi:hypothetical protein
VATANSGGTDGSIPQGEMPVVTICTAGGFDVYPTIISDNSGGAISEWQDFRSAGNYDTYAQWIDANGTLPLANGDVNGDSHMDLADATLCLQVLSGLTPGNTNPAADVDGDNKIGMAEAIYAMQKTAGMR